MDGVLEGLCDGVPVTDAVSLTVGELEGENKGVRDAEVVDVMLGVTEEVGVREWLPELDGAPDGVMLAVFEAVLVGVFEGVPVDVLDGEWDDV